MSNRKSWKKIGGAVGLVAAGAIAGGVGDRHGDRQRPWWSGRPRRA